MSKGICCIIAAMILMSAPAWGQITGKVTDKSTQEPLVAATVVIKGTSKGVVTDMEGQFSLSAGDIQSGTIVVSYISYANVEITFNNSTQNLGTIVLEQDAIGLDEVKISASFVDERKTPVAVSSITAEQINQRFSGLSVPDMITSTPGIYTTQGAGGYGDQEIYIRGFDQTNVAFLINGIPVNDMENGLMYWSNFAGISEATREMQVQRGLGASKLAISSIGGTVNMISQPAQKSRGGSFEYMNSNASWNNRLRMTLNTGETEKGWAMTFQGARTTTSPTLGGMSADQRGPIRPGAFVDAWSYYLALSKQINKRHQLLFYAFGAPFNRGSAWYLSDDLIKQGGYTNTDRQFNYAAGYKNGEFFNGRQNKVHKPQFSLSHYWDIDDFTSVSTSAYMSVARVTSIQPRVTLGFNKTTPAVRDTEIRTREGYLDYDLLIAENQAGNPVTVDQPNGDPFADPITGHQAQNFLESRHNDHIWYGVISSLDKQFGNTDIKLGVDFRNYKGSHYVTAFDLLGADFVSNSDRGEYDQSREYDMNLLVSNQAIQQGDKFMYDYDSHILWGSAFMQAETHIGNLDLFTSLSATQNQYYRVGHFWNEEFSANSLGKSEKKNFFSYTAKAGAGYRITNRHKVFANIGHFTRPPFMRYAFQDARFSNDYTAGLNKEKVYAGEAGYAFIAGFLKANLNAYYIIWQDRVFNASGTGLISDSDVEQNISEVFFNVPGMSAVHKGIELDFVWNVITPLEINGFVSLGDYKWDKDVTVPNPYTGEASVISAKGLPTGNSAQHTAQIGVHYKGIRDMYIGGRYNYAGKLYVQHDPTDEFLRKEDPKQLPDYTLLDLYIGRYFDISDDLRGRLSANVNNVQDKEYVRWATDFFGESNAYGYGRNYYLSMTIYF